MQEHQITVNKSARVFTAGNLNSATQQVWIVLHGHGHTAGQFLKKFDSLLNENIFFIAPEALNHYYLKGTSGEVGATWMIKENRLKEIEDYVHYLDTVYTHFNLQHLKNCSITGLGFSQGSSTLTRWIDGTSSRIDRAIVYAGEVAPELLPLKADSNLRKTKNYFIYGNKDEYFSKESFDKMITQYSELNFTLLPFEGGHEIKPEVLSQLTKT